MSDSFLIKNKHAFVMMLILFFVVGTTNAQSMRSRNISSKEDYFETLSMSIRAFNYFHWRMPNNVEELKSFTKKWLLTNGFDNKYIDKMIRHMHNNAFVFMASENSFVLVDRKNKCIWIEPDNLCDLALSNDTEKRLRFYSFMPVLVDENGETDINLCEDFENKLDSIRSLYPNDINIIRCNTISQVIVLQYTFDAGLESICGENIANIVELSPNFIEKIISFVREYMLNHKLSLIKFYMKNLRKKG